MDTKFNDWGSVGLAAADIGCVPTTLAFGSTGALATTDFDGNAAADVADKLVLAVLVRLGGDTRIDDEPVVDGNAFSREGGVGRLADGGLRNNGDWTCGSMLGLVGELAAAVCAPPLLCTSPLRGSLEADEPGDADPDTDVELDTSAGGVTVAVDPLGADEPGDESDDDNTAGEEGEPDGDDDESADGVPPGGELFSGDEAPDELAPDVSSAHAAGAPRDTAAPTPNATANPPTRPTKRASPCSETTRCGVGASRCIIASSARCAEGVALVMGSITRIQLDERSRALLQFRAVRRGTT